MLCVVATDLPVCTQNILLCVCALACVRLKFCFDFYVAVTSVFVSLHTQSFVFIRLQKTIFILSVTPSVGWYSLHSSTLRNLITLAFAKPSNALSILLMVNTGHLWYPPYDVRYI